MDGAGRHLDAVAKVPCLSGGLCCTWHRRRAVAVDRDGPADAVGDPVRGVAVLPYSKTRTPLQRGDIHHERNRTMENPQEYYKSCGPMTAPGTHMAELSVLPKDLAALCE